LAENQGEAKIAELWEGLRGQLVKPLRKSRTYQSTDVPLDAGWGGSEENGIKRSLADVNETLKDWSGIRGKKEKREGGKERAGYDSLRGNGRQNLAHDTKRGCPMTTQNALKCQAAG